MDVEITELEKIDADRVDGVGSPANGIQFILMKQVGDAEPELEKDWADWDAAHEGGGRGRPSGKGDSKASAADAVARAKQAIADHKAGKKVSAADLKNAHEVHEAHLAHEAKLKAEGKEPAASKPKAPAKPAAKPAAKKSALDIVVKAVTDGMIDQEPDIGLGHQIMALLAQAIQQEAQEIGAGSYGETCDVELLNCAAAMIGRWVGREAAPGTDDDGDSDSAMTLMQSVMDDVTKGRISLNRGRELLGLKPFDFPEADVPVNKSRDYSAAERKEMADDGRALPDGSYPINDEHDLNSAAILARSGHGDVSAAQKHIGKRAKELGVKNPLENGDDTAKSQIAKDETNVDTVTQETGGLTKAVEDAVAKATAPLLKDIADLKSARDADRAELAKVKATPVPGGPMMTAVRPARAADGEDHAAKAARYEETAAQLADPGTADHYRQLAAQERAKITIP